MTRRGYGIFRVRVSDTWHVTRHTAHRNRSCVTCTGAKSRCPIASFARLATPPPALARRIRGALAACIGRLTFRCCSGAGHRRARPRRPSRRSCQGIVGIRATLEHKGAVPPSTSLWLVVFALSRWVAELLKGKKPQGLACHAELLLDGRIRRPIRMEADAPTVAPLEGEYAATVATRRTVGYERSQMGA